MENKINVAELLKDCPSDMELNCVMFENLYFDCIDDSLKNDPFPICCYYVNDNEARNRVRFSKYGTYLNLSNDKCVIFPKGKNTWEGFVPPVEFKDGDIVTTRTSYHSWISIYKENRKEFNEDARYTYVDYEKDCKDFCVNDLSRCFVFGRQIITQRLATEEEKRKLFDAIAANGYKWNAETKTLERIIKPKFKVGDRIQYNGCDYKPIYIIKSIEANRYIFDNGDYIKFGDENHYSLLKFDISSLKPFDKVLVRNSNDLDWACDLFSHLRHEDSLLNRFRCIDMSYKYCIPYGGNEHLRGTNNDCDEFYKTWEE